MCATQSGVWGRFCACDPKVDADVNKRFSNSRASEPTNGVATVSTYKVGFLLFLAQYFSRQALHPTFAKPTEPRGAVTAPKRLCLLAMSCRVPTVKQETAFFSIG